MAETTDGTREPTDTATDTDTDTATGTGTDCLFCRIVAGEVPADVVVRGERALAFRDIDRQAPTHVLVVPLEHHADVAALATADPAALAELVQVGRQVAADEGHEHFRLVFNTGSEAGQSVFHVHGHVLAGRPMTWPPG